MPKGKKKARIDEAKLTKGQARKFRALRKSLGDEIARRAFAEWLSQNGKAGEATDKNASKIADTLWQLVKSKQLRIGRGGYLVKRGRGRLIVRQSSATKA
jgi:hypothetical protein